MNIKKINWIPFESQFSTDWLGEIEGLAIKYCIILERDSGKVKISDLKNEHIFKNTIAEAKEYCQKDLETMINNLILK